MKKNAIIAIVMMIALVCSGGYLYIQNEKAMALVQQQEQAAAEM